MDFIAKKFCQVLDGLVDEEIEPQDCHDPLKRVLGEPVTIARLTALDARGQKQLCAAFVEWFECDTIGLADIQEAIAAVRDSA